MQQRGCRMVECLVVPRVKHTGVSTHPMAATGQSTLVLSAAYDRDLFMLLHTVVVTDITSEAFSTLCNTFAIRMATHAAEMYRLGLVYIDLKFENALHNDPASADTVGEVVLCDYGSVVDLATAQARRLCYGDLTHTRGNLDPRHEDSRIEDGSYPDVVAYALAHDCTLFVKEWSSVHHEPVDTREVSRSVWADVHRTVSAIIARHNLWHRSSCQ